MNFAHVEQHYQYSKAIHHDEVETASAIMSLTNPLRIKSLGDGILSDSTWLERRMLVLYDGVRAKFEQNLVLQDELLSTDGKHLYEATTDSYFGCGLGYDSKRWQQKDWSGENVAGLILKKVRDELLGISPEDGDKNSTLTEIAVEEESSSIEEMESSSYHEDKDDVVLVDNAKSSSQDTDSPSSETNLQSKSAGTDDQPSDDKDQYQTPQYGLSQRGRGKGRGRGRGRGRGKGTRSNPQRSQVSNNWRNSMSAADRNFLGLKEKPNNNSKNKNKKASKSKERKVSTPGPNHMIWSTLNDKQKKGLADLGLTPDLFKI